MNNRKQVKKVDNVIQFPNLERRLVEKGLELLHQKKFHEAIPLLEQAILLDPFNSDSQMGLVLAYFDAGMVDKAKQLVGKMLFEGIGDYFEVMNLYLMLLVQVHKYDEVVSVLEELFVSEKIPKEQFENFNRLLHFSRRMLDTPIQQENENERYNEPHKELNLAQYQDSGAQIGLAAELKERNIQPYLMELIDYLQSNDGGAFFKSLILNILRDHLYDQPVLIQKFGRKITVIPKTLTSLNDNPQLKDITKAIGQRLENEDPILYDHIKKLVERQFFLLYPFKLEPDDVAIWAAAYHSLGNEYYGNRDTDDELMDSYHVLQMDMKKADSFIRMIEEISYQDI